MIALAVATLAGPAAATERSQPVTATAVEFGGKAGLTRFVLETSAEPAFNVFPVADPPRIVIDIEDLAFALGDTAARTPPRSSLLKDWRFGEIAPGRARIVLDARAPVLPQSAFFLPAMGDRPGRVVVELAPAEPAAFAAAVARADAGAPPRAGAADTGRSHGRARGNPDAPLVMIDPGHGGIDPGATGPDGIEEKAITLAFSDALAESLAGRGDLAVRMTRSDDRFLSLADRVEQARAAGADLFVSIHADAAPQHYVRGATVYTLSERPSDAEAALMAARENRVDALAGLAVESEDDEVTDIFVDLMRRETRLFSRRFADLVLDELAGTVRLINNPHRSARFRVLMAHEIPSVLVEIGYLSNREDAALMVQPTWRQKVAERVAAAVSRYFDERGDPSAPAVRADLPIPTAR